MGKTVNSEDMETSKENPFRRPNSMREDTFKMDLYIYVIAAAHFKA
jgi:hypothetical protein